MAIDREKLLLSAAKLAERKKYDKAIAEYQRIVEHDPKDARTLLKIGDLQSRMLDYHGAIATYYKVADHYANDGFHLKAIAVFKQIRELIKKHAPELSAQYAHVTPRLADIYAQLNLITDALAAYDEVATLHQKAGRDREAIEVFKKTVALDPKNPLPHLRLAEACCRVQEVDQAIDSFWTAAELLLGMQRPDDALKVIERILHFRQDPVYARAAAHLYLNRSEPQAGMQALAKLQIAFQANPKDLDTLALLAQAFQLIGQPEKAIAVHVEMARLARDKGKIELWQQIMDHLRQVAPENDQVVALLKAGPPRDAEAEPAQAPAAAGPASARLAPRPQTPPPTIEVREDTYEGVEDDEDEDAEPIDLNEEVEYIERPPPAAPPEYPSSSPPEQWHGGEQWHGSEQAHDSQQTHGGHPWPGHEPNEPAPPSAPASQPWDQAPASRQEGVDVSGAPSLAAEESGAPGSFRPAAHAHKAIVDAESFRRLGLLDKAVEALHIALEIDPNSVPIREKLREILVDAGEREPAIQETINIAIIHIHNQEPDLAEPLALEVLEIEPDHPDAGNILQHVQVLREAQTTASADGHLESYDLEGVRPQSAMGEMPGDARLPSFDIDEPGTGTLVGPSEHPPSASQKPPQSRRSATSKRPSHEAIEEVLEEAEFFAAQGLFSDAEAILTDMLKQVPGHVLLSEHLDEVRQARDASDYHEPAPAAVETPDDKAFDIAASLDALDDLDPSPQQPHVASHQDEVDVDQVFAKFKEGVKATVEDSDAATHYDLGVAYKEMGLLADALSEFELASRDPERACTCFAMIGLTYRELGQLDDARQAYQSGLASPVRTADEEKNLRYELARIAEEEGETDEYLEQLKTIAAMDPGYRDVSARIRALGAQVPDSDEDDDLDAAFENLLGH